MATVPAVRKLLGRIGPGVDDFDPVGATGAILTIKTPCELEQISGWRALVNMCIGGGQGIALATEGLAA